MIKILTEGGSKKGYGHIFRCITIAKEFSAYMIVDCDMKDNIKNLYSNMRFELWQNEEWIINNISKNDVVFVDSYNISLEQIEQIKGIAKDTIIIDDLFRFDYKNLKIVNPNNFGDNIKYDSSNIVLAGNKYMLVRDEFAGHIKSKISKKVKNIFVIFGGTDILNLVPKMIKYINETLTFDDAVFHIVTSEHYVDTPRIKFYNMLNGTEIRDLMLLSDFTISAGGQTINELIRLAVPFICVEVIDNQRINIAGALDKGYCIEFDYNNFNRIGEMSSYIVRKRMHIKMKSDYYEETGAHYIKRELF